MISPFRLKLTRTVMSIGMASEADGGLKQPISRSNVSLSVLMGGPAWMAGLPGPCVVDWIGCGLAAWLGAVACAQAAEIKAWEASAISSGAAASGRIEVFLLAAIAVSCAISYRKQPGP